MGLPNFFTFTRASSATAFNSSGTLVTVSSDVPRFDFNPSTLAPRGLLLEGARTNLLLNSATLSTQNVTVTAVAYTISFYGTGSITLSGAFAGSLSSAGAFPARATLTFTPSAGTLTVTVSGTVTNANLEVGSFASSWIPTTGSTATRAADSPPALSNLALIGFNALEGTILSSFETMGQSPSAGIYCFGTSGFNSIQYRRGFGAPAEAINFSTVAGVGQAGLTVSPTNNFTIYKNAFAYKINDFGASTNGAAVLTDTSGTIPSVSVLRLGGSNTTGEELFGWLRLFAYTPFRLPNATLQTLSA
jgi:hypothetical protein